MAGPIEFRAPFSSSTTRSAVSAAESRLSSGNGQICSGLRPVASAMAFTTESRAFPAAVATRVSVSTGAKPSKGRRFTRGRSPKLATRSTRGSTSLRTTEMASRISPSPMASTSPVTACTPEAAMPATSAPTTSRLRTPSTLTDTFTGRAEMAREQFVPQATLAALNVRSRTPATSFRAADEDARASTADTAARPD